MTDQLRQAAQQALENLEKLEDLMKKSITALTTALAQEHAMHDLARLGQEIEQGKRGSIALARSLCYQINGAADDSVDMDGGGYGSVDIAEILSAEVVRLKKALAQPQQQAEPEQEQKYEKRIVPYSTPLSMILNTAPPQQQAEPPQQQAEPPPEWPLIKNILAVFGLDAISFVAKWQAAQQQAEPVQENKTLIEWKERGEAIMAQAGVGFRLGAWWADRPWRQK